MDFQNKLIFLKMDGLAGFSGWRWLFLLEGLPAIILSFIALFGLPDYPETARMLTEKERAVVVHRLASIKVSGKAENWSWRAIGDLFKDPTLYSFAAYWICHGIGGFGINYALPTVIYELGFTTTALSQLMNIVRHNSIARCNIHTDLSVIAAVRERFSLPQYIGLDAAQ